ncbi:MAG: zinc-ribbon domain-containing protein [Gemmobacter sp.]
MRLICPNCDAQYEVDDGAIPQGGRDVQCSNCGHAWFQMSADLSLDMALAEDDEAPVAAAAPPPPVQDHPSAPIPDAPQAVAPAAAPHPPTPPLAATAEGPVRRTLDDNLLTVLREEAAREAAERRAEAARLETQAELGPLEPAARAAAVPPPPARPIEDLTGDVPDHPVSQRPNPRRDLLPDIEEINSTLRPGSEARDHEMAAALAPAPRRGAFRSGFFSVLLAAVVLVIVYAMAPQLSARFPTVAPTLTAYVATVDALRVWLDGLMQSAAGGLRGLTGEG